MYSHVTWLVLHELVRRYPDDPKAHTCSQRTVLPFRHLDTPAGSTLTTMYQNKSEY